MKRAEVLAGLTKRNILQSAVRMRCGEAGIPFPTFEYEFADSRKWRFDFCWPQWHVAVEQEGAIWTKGRHVRGAGFLVDMEKYNTATYLGWKLYRFTPQQVASGAWLPYVLASRQQHDRRESGRGAGSD